MARCSYHGLSRPPPFALLCFTASQLYSAVYFVCPATLKPWQPRARQPFQVTTRVEQATVHRASSRPSRPSALTRERLRSTVGGDGEESGQQTKTLEAAVVETPVDEKAPTPVSEKLPSVTDLESSGTDEEEWTYPDGGWRAWGAFRLLLSAIQVLILRRYYHLATLL